MNKAGNTSTGAGVFGPKVMMKVAGMVHRMLYRLSKGRIGQSMMGMSVLLLTTTGRKTGQSRTWPLAYLADEGGDLIVIASAGGAPTHPAWYLNLRATPRVTVQQGAQSRVMVAQITEGEERALLWARVVKEYPAYAGYARKTSRQIPVVRLQPTSPTPRG